MARLLFAVLLIALSVVKVSGQCGVVINSFPYTEGFEAAAAWTSGGSGDDWAWGTPAHPLINSAGGGTKSWCVGGLTGQTYTNDAQSWLESPCFDFTSLDRPWISLKIFWEVERQYDGMVLQYSLDQGGSWANVGAFGDPVDCLNENWFNEDNVTNIDLAVPPHGWSGRSGSTLGACLGGFGSEQWITATHCMPYLANAPSVKFRLLFGAGSTCNGYDGIAIDDILIQNSPLAVVMIGTVCTANTVTFNAEVTGCAGAISWDFGDPASGAANTATGQSADHTFSGPGAYSVTLTVASPCGPFSSVVQDIQVADLQANVVPASCGQPNGSIEAVIGQVNGPFTYTLDPGGTGNDPLFDGLPAGSYTLSVEFPNGCPASITVVVDGTASTLVVDVSATDVSCAGYSDGAATAVVSGGDPVAYAWAPTGGSAATAIDLPAGDYVITVTAADGCTASASVTVNEPAPLVVDLAPQQTICAGTSTTLIADVSGGTGTYTSDWSPDGPDVSPLTSTIYTLIVTDANGCTSSPAVTDVEVVMPPIAELYVADSAGCVPHCVAFNVAPAGMASYAFDYGDGESGDSPAHCYLRPGEFDVSLTVVDANGCTAIVTQPGLVRSWPSPSAGFTAPQVVIISDPPVRLIDASSGAEGWSWDLGLGDSTAISNEPSPLFTPMTTGCFTVRQVVSNNFGCVDSTSQVICVEDEFALYAPNTFTPNGDGFNEVFSVVTTVTAPSSFMLRVFDRWGGEVHATADPGEGWSGNGAPVGIYAWNLMLRDSQNKLRKAQGHVLLLR